MNNNDYDAEFDQHDSFSSANGLRWMSMLVIVLIIFGFFSLVWYAYNATDMSTPQGTTPVITADNQDYKIKPEDVGGLRVIDKDIESYQLMRRDPSAIEEGKVIERLRPQSEAPVIVERIEEAEATVATTQQDTEEATNAADDAAETLSAEAEDTAADKLDVLVNDATRKTYEVIESTDSVDVVAPVKKKPAPIQKIAEPAPEKKEVIKKEEPKPVAESGVYVQLAAMRSEAEAERLWRKVSETHSGLLGDKSHYVQPVDVPGTGKLYRLRVTGMGTHKAAAELCSKLKARSQTCIASK